MYLKSSYVTNDTEQIHGVNGDNEATFFVYCFDVAWGGRGGEIHLSN